MVLVTGANGYIGVHTVAALIKQGYTVRALVRSSTKEEEQELLKSLGAMVCVAQSEMPVDDTRALDGVEHIVHLVGSIQKPAHSTFEAMHAGITGRLVEAGKQSRIKKLVYISVIGAAPDAATPYHITKRQAESAIEKSGIPYTILRPSLVFGRRVGKRNSKLIQRMIDITRNAPCVPLLGGGKQRLQPIHIDDLAACIVSSLTNASLLNKTVEIGGPEVLTFSEIMDIIARSMNIKKLRLPIPLTPVLVLVSMLEKLSITLPVSTDQVRMMRNDNVCREDSFSRFFQDGRISVQDGIRECID